MRIDAAFAGGTLVPSPDAILPLTLDADGAFTTLGKWPNGIAAGNDFYFQVWILDPAGPRGLAATNALLAMAK